MKKRSAILFVSIFFILSGLVFSQETIEPSQLIVGKWKTSGNIVYEFTVDNKVIKQNKEYATYLFSEGVLILSYLDEGGPTYETGLEFKNEGANMTLTEKKDHEDNTILHFRRLEE